MHNQLFYSINTVSTNTVFTRFTNAKADKPSMAMNTKSLHSLYKTRTKFLFLLRLTDFPSFICIFLRYAAYSGHSFSKILYSILSVVEPYSLGNPV